jgi:DNA-3-methyladenine glycosylase I
VEAPAQVKVAKLADYLEVMSKAVFQSGMSWAVVKNKWEGTREALDGFDPEKLADFTPADIDRLMTDARLIRNRKKIEGIVHNARTLLELEREFGSIEKYLDSLGDFEASVADLKKRFKFMGDLGSYYFLYVVQRPVPPHDEWKASRR